MIEIRRYDMAHLSHSLFPERDVISSEGDPGNHLEMAQNATFFYWKSKTNHLLWVTLHNHPTVDHLVKGQHNHLGG